MNEISFLVRVTCMTYNHAPYIVDAMNGFTIQETNFPYLCVIIDDASTDGEPEVIRQYLHDNFELDDALITRQDETEDFVRVFSRHKNNLNCYFLVVLLKYNHFSIKKPKSPYFIDWIRGIKYIAMCEGDDYWIAKDKLQKQVDIMESHPRVGLVHARAKVFNQKRGLFVGSCGEQNGNLEATILKNPIVTLTTCYRSSLSSSYGKEITKSGRRGWLMSDYPVWIWMSGNSELYFMDEEVAVYREVEGSATHKTLDDKLKFIKSTVDIRLFFAELFHLSEELKKKIVYNAEKSSALACYQYGEVEKANQYMDKLNLLDKWRIRLRRQCKRM